MNRVGLIEDNLDYRAEVAFHLRRNGFEIALESDGTGLDLQRLGTLCDLLVLDLGLPLEDGFVIARRVRTQHPALGIVMLTARGGLDDRLTGLKDGADAYLVKPVDMRELVATLQAVQRRLGTVEPNVAVNWTLVPAMLSLRSPVGEVISLTAMELTLLTCLAAAAPQPVGREALAAAMGFTNPDFDTRRLEVAFSRLRSKIEALAPSSEPVIRALRHRGYLFAAPIVTSHA